MAAEKRNLVIILGPTGVGKSATAVKLARCFSGEIINCDSMQVYRGFDIGTDKISEEKKQGIPHHLLDAASPASQFTAADFVRLSLKAMKEIRGRGKLPIITGGTGLYLKALLDGLFPEDSKDLSIRNNLKKEASSKGWDELWSRLLQVDPEYAQKISPNDKVRIIRALEVHQATGIPLSRHFPKTEPFIKNDNLVIIGLKLDRESLYQRINNRVEAMMEKGLTAEVKNLIGRGVPESAPSFRALGYKYILSSLHGEISLTEAVRLTKRDTRRYAKRQMTWFKKMRGIHWFSPYDFPLIKKHVEERLE
ncbi:MAG: tRNA (adenosine(37)-N6)-dimethylallyltransferase MiaA [Candidatus Aminicenantes bacterium]